MTAIDVTVDLTPGVRVRRWPWTRGTVTRSHEFWGWFVKWDGDHQESGPYHDDDLQPIRSHPADTRASRAGAGSTAPSGASPLLGAPNETRSE